MVKGAVQLKLQRKVKEKEDIVREKMIRIEACEEKLCQILGGEDFKLLSRKMLNSLVVEEPKMCILSSNVDVIKSKLPKKGKVEGAIRG